MATEGYAVMMIMVLLWIILIVLDAAVCGILHLISGIGFRAAFLWGLIALILPPVLTLYGAVWERNDFQVKEVEINIANLPEDFEGYRIVHISDIHARSFIGREKHLENAVNIINGLQADLIAFTGDLITMLPGELDSIVPSLAGLKAEDGVVSVLGNHDYCQYTDISAEEKSKALEDLISRQKSMGWNLLLNEKLIINRGEDSIAVVGVENTSPSRYFFSRGDLAKASDGTDSLFRIVLSHDPLHWESEIIGKDYPLTLSGHTHSMQLSIFGWSPCSIIFPQYRGLYATSAEEKETPSEGEENICTQYLYVNIGLGETIFPARIGTRPEITVLTLNR